MEACRSWEFWAVSCKSESSLCMSDILFTFQFSFTSIEHLIIYPTKKKTTIKYLIWNRLVIFSLYEGLISPCLYMPNFGTNELFWQLSSTSCYMIMNLYCYIVSYISSDKTLGCRWKISIPISPLRTESMLDFIIVMVIYQVFFLMLLVSNTVSPCPFFFSFSISIIKKEKIGSIQRIGRRKK